MTLFVHLFSSLHDFTTPLTISFPLWARPWVGERQVEKTAEERIVPQAGGEFPPVWLPDQIPTDANFEGKPGHFCAQFLLLVC